MWGFYSQKARDSFRRAKKFNCPGEIEHTAIVYLTPDGREVIVTLVQKNESKLDKNSYFWPDTVSVGEVTKFVRLIFD
jgi:hypothetical protein